MRVAATQVDNLGLVLKDGRFELTELLKNQVALLATVQLNTVDGSARLNGGAVERIERSVEERIQQG
ncbi:hypothetical protein HYQ46_004996 [Verticillium longisporum]|nr:hypothetical protein HYQ46_004996 [Verticillium longisporum]